MLFRSVVTSAGLGALLAWLWHDSFPAHFTPGFAALAAVPVAILGVVSDLIESVIKRRADRKDSGHSIPGIGGVFSPRAGGASTLAAMVVPAERLEVVAAQVSAFEGINHNYEREAPGPRDPNLWFVAAAPDAAALAGMLLAIEAATGLAVLRLPLQRQIGRAHV